MSGILLAVELPQFPIDFANPIDTRFNLKSHFRILLINFIYLCKRGCKILFSNEGVGK
jgi:hypothetical protein